MKEFITGEKRIIVYGLFILLGVFLSVAVFYGLEFYKISEDNKIAREKETVLLKRDKELEKRQSDRKEIVDSLKVEAKSFYVFDLDKDEDLFSKNKDKRLGIASLTKIATSAVMINALKNSLDLKGTNIFILKKNLAKSGDNGLKWGEKFEWKKLLKFMMIASSNDAASAMANNLGVPELVKRMNSLTEDLEMDKTFFFSESGLDVNENILGSYSTAVDVAKLVKYFYKKYPEFSAEFSASKTKICSEKICHNVENTNKLLFDKKVCLKPADNSDTVGCLEEKIERFPYKILFSKTGYTKKSGGSVVMISEISGHRILIVVLGSGKESRFTDMETISEAAEKYLEIK